MEHQLVQKEAFTIIGKSILTSTREGQNSKQIPKFWQDSHADGTVRKLTALGETEELLGLCYDAQQNGEYFKYAIAVESNAPASDYGFERIQIPSATWAVFTSIGPMPGAIQEVWGRIYREWFPTSGFKQAEGFNFELYLPGDTTSEDYRCKAWIPIVRK
ncbi:GyrI-like domain-containing protein [Paenibacillus sinopodophylli]|uniref:GyrI-like domain-containing protein n=1 Tax=Paenibacillus sinopodophylli TaxID=1837342 RepID=UPI001485FC94|nr:GyrI-like domain-containing protein [Paenibacillus sinopodophylli]